MKEMCSICDVVTSVTLTRVYSVRRDLGNPSKIRRPGIPKSLYQWVPNFGTRSPQLESRHSPILDDFQSKPLLHPLLVKVLEALVLSGMLSYSQEGASHDNENIKSPPFTTI